MLIHRTLEHSRPKNRTLEHKNMGTWNTIILEHRIFEHRALEYRTLEH